MFRISAALASGLCRSSILPSTLRPPLFARCTARVSFNEIPSRPCDDALSHSHTCPLLPLFKPQGDYKLGLSFPSSAGSDSTGKSCPLLSLSLSLSPVSTSSSSCSGGDTWPEIPENIDQKLSGCGPDTPSTDRCMQDVYSAKFTYSASPSWRRYHFFTAAGDSTHFRAEVPSFLVCPEP